jgi:hypothetical protein
MTLAASIQAQHRDLLTMQGVVLTLHREGERLDFLAVEDRMSGSWSTLAEPALVVGDIVQLPGRLLPGVKQDVIAVMHNGITGQEFVMRTKPRWFL